MIIQIVLDDVLDADMIATINREAGKNKSAYTRYCLRDYFRRRDMGLKDEVKEVPLVRAKTLDSIMKMKK